MTIPPAPQVTAPAARSSFASDEPVSVAWTPFADATVGVRFALTARDDLSVEGAFDGLRSHSRVVRQAPPRPSTFVATFVATLP